MVDLPLWLLFVSESFPTAPAISPLTHSLLLLSLSPSTISPFSALRSLGSQRMVGRHQYTHWEERHLPWYICGGNRIAGERLRGAALLCIGEMRNKRRDTRNKKCSRKERKKGRKSVWFRSDIFLEDGKLGRKKRKREEAWEGIVGDAVLTEIVRELSCFLTVLPLLFQLHAKWKLVWYIVDFSLLGGLCVKRGKREEMGIGMSKKGVTEHWSKISTSSWWWSTVSYFLRVSQFTKQ